MRAPVASVVAAMRTEAWGNPASPHRAGRAAAAVVDRARSQLAVWLGRDPREIVFTSGATEGNALVLLGLRTAARPLVICSAVEHPSVLAHADETIPVDAHGRLELAALDAMLLTHGERAAVVSVMAANNETGVLQPLHEISARCRAHGVPLHTDATQIFGRVAPDLPAELVTLSAHKGGGPKGVGVVATDRSLSPVLRGGPQNRGMRAGTLAVALIAGFGEAAATAPTLGSEDRDDLEAACRALGGRVLGAGASRLPNTLAVRFGVPGDLLVMALDLAGVMASTGSACASGAPGRSHVMAAMGESGVPVRFSLGAASVDVPAVAEVLRQCVHQVETACGSSQP
jgi:cysteine desulfurase